MDVSKHLEGYTLDHFATGRVRIPVEAVISAADPYLVMRELERRAQLILEGDYPARPVELHDYHMDGQNYLEWYSASSPRPNQQVHE